MHSAGVGGLAARSVITSDDDYAYERDFVFVEQSWFYDWQNISWRVSMLLHLFLQFGLSVVNVLF